MLVLSWIVFVLFVLATLADLYTTKRSVIDNPIRFREGNPFIAFFLARLGIWSLVAIKGLAIALVGYALFAYPGVATLVSGIGCTLLTGYVAYRNKHLLSKN